MRDVSGRSKRLSPTWQNCTIQGVLAPPVKASSAKKIKRIGSESSGGRKPKSQKEATCVAISGELSLRVGNGSWSGTGRIER